MSWLKKIVSKTSAQGADQPAEEALNGMPYCAVPHCVNPSLRRRESLLPTRQTRVQ